MIENIATHRTDVVMLWTEDDMDSWKETIHNSRHTRFPICEGSPDHVIGVLNTKEYFRTADKSRENILRTAVHTPYFVLETTRADVVFKNMKLTKHSMAIVIDEYGGMTGIVTLSDLIEELVGDLSDEFSDDKGSEPELKRINDGIWRIRGNIELCVLEETLGQKLISSEFDTLTGLVFDELGIIPEDGERDIEIEIQNLQIQIKCIKDHQIEEAIIELQD